ncbi:MAG: response regulator transcription factor [Clostridia bacterium]|nr:response regulator transcription factor [Clostridia bacterium]
MPLIYIVEDDENIAELISATLGATLYETAVCPDYEALKQAIKTRTPDLILLDIMLPQKNGFDILQDLKASTATGDIPVIFLSAKGTELDKVKGLDLGAEDYITKPFGVLELQARVKAALRRKPVEENKVRIFDLEIDFSAREIFRGSELIKLTFKEFELLEFLYHHAGKVISREQLLDNIWGYSYDGDTTRTVDMHIRSLRQKLGDNAENSKYIETVRGYGYKMKRGNGA